MRLLRLLRFAARYDFRLDTAVVEAAEEPKVHQAGRRLVFHSCFVFFFVFLYSYIYIYMYVYIYMYIYIYVYWSIRMGLAKGLLVALKMIHRSLWSVGVADWFCCSLCASVNFSRFTSFFGGQMFCWCFVGQQLYGVCCFMWSGDLGKPQLNGRWSPPFWFRVCSAGVIVRQKTPMESTFY